MIAKEDLLRRQIKVAHDKTINKPLLAEAMQSLLNQLMEILFFIFRLYTVQWFGIIRVYSFEG